MTTRKVNMAFCSFCGKRQDQVTDTIAGPNDIHICCECVELCNDILAENKAKRAEAKE